MVGLFTVATVGIATIVDLWQLADLSRNLTLRQVGRHFAARALCLIVLPIVLYLVPFYIHFSICVHSGTGDNFMSLRFQETLLGNKQTLGSASTSLFLFY
jgi:dolichyl-phosphate-mannose-protein mannosyltransferase